MLPRKHVHLLVAAAVFAGASSAGASVILVITPITLTNATLTTNWIGFKIQLVGVGATVAGFDFANSGGGIFGHFHQRWTIGTDPDTGDPLPAAPTPTGPFPVATATGSAGTDSFFGFNQTLLLSNPNPLTEDNNKVNGSNPPFTRSPISDTASNDFGVGTTMTGSGVIAAANQSATLNLAFIIISKAEINAGVLGQGTNVIRGVATDSLGAQSTIFYDFACTPGIPPCDPEPASLGLLALGSLPLLSRRARRVHNPRP